VAGQHFLAEIVADAERWLELVRGTRATLEDTSPAGQELVGAAEVLAWIWPRTSSAMSTGHA
jgi:hypothetical protein